MVTFIIIGIVLFLFLLLILFFLHSRNQLKEFLQKIEASEHEIEELLDKKLDLLERTVPFIEENQKEEAPRLEKLQTIKEEKLNNFELFRYLNVLAHELKLILADHGELENIKQLKTILEFEIETEGQLLGVVEYYNHNAREYNELCQTFPHKIAKSLLHYPKKDIYKKEKLEDFEILKK